MILRIFGKNSDPAIASEFFKIYIWILVPLTPLGIGLAISRDSLSFFLLWMLGCLGGGFFLTLGVMWLTSAVGSAAGSLWGGKKSNWSLRQRLVADLDVARVAQNRGEHERALALVDGVLAKDPCFPDALYLRARILWCGFQDSQEARRCLKKILTLVTDGNDPVRRWALDLQEEVMGRKRSPGKTIWDD